MISWKKISVVGPVSLVVTVLGGCSENTPPIPKDDAGGRTGDSFPELAEDVFQPMDGGIALAPDEVKGRNTWNLWCGGNEQFWDRMARESFGLMDLLRTIDSRQRGERFAKLGLINQPGFRQASKPDAHGVWLDEAVEPEARSIDPAVYGRSTGILGFRLFDNPDFKGDAVARWDAKRYYDEPGYAQRPELVRPYRVGVSCGACHIAFNPSKPPADPVNPKWDELASAIGNQYIREGPVFASLVEEGGLFAEMFKTQPPGTSDTSRIATDHINNPNMINPIFELGARLSVAHEEHLSGESRLVPPGLESARVPHVLKDGADSIGVAGATLRVYVNIGMYSQHWLQQHNALIGLGEQRPFSIQAAQENSVYWRATASKVGNIAKFFMRLKSFRLEDAPGGKDYITSDPAVMERGKIAFAENCAQCHSSKRPPSELAKPKSSADEVLASDTSGEDAQDWFKKEVLKPDFRADNFFSDERAYPVTRIKTNVARACGSNAQSGHIWSNFSSDSYKQRSSVGAVKVWNPYTDLLQDWQVPGGGSGYYRTPSLVCLWSSAPFLHNNALGKFTGDPSVKGRMEAFEDAAEKLLWPEKRLGKGSIWRTTKESQLQIRKEVLPSAVRAALEIAHAIDSDGYFRLGPIPAGTPVNLLANLDPKAGTAKLVELCLAIKKTMIEIKLKKLDSAAAKQLMREQVAERLLAASSCPDLIEDHGHEFGSELPDDDKRALIEYLKTL